MGKSWSGEEAIKRELTKENGDVKEGDVDREDGFFGEKAVKIKNCGDSGRDDEETDEFGEEIVGLWAVDKTVYETPGKGGSESDFDVFPSRFVDGAKEAGDAVVVRPVIEKVGKGADGRDNNDAKPEDENIVHVVIIA